MKTYKEILESRKEMEHDPLVYSYTDSKGKDMLGHMNLSTACSLYNIKSSDVREAKGFYSGEMIKTNGKWSGAKNIYIQISDHSEFKK